MPAMFGAARRSEVVEEGDDGIGSWLARTRASIRTLAPGFCAGRMPDDYLQRIYTPTTTSPTG